MCVKGHYMCFYFLIKSLFNDCVIYHYFKNSTWHCSSSHQNEVQDSIPILNPSWLWNLLLAIEYSWRDSVRILSVVAFPLAALGNPRWISLGWRLDNEWHMTWVPHQQLLTAMLTQMSYDTSHRYQCSVVTWGAPAKITWKLLSWAQPTLSTHSFMS